MSKPAQSANAALLVRPVSFGFHAEAAQSNAFAAAVPADQVAVLREFDGVAAALSAAGVQLLVLDDTPNPPKPDAIFPNNWVSFHEDGTVVLYPMATAARRPERNVDDIQALLGKAGFQIDRIVDLSFHERSGHFLEGTGSLVLDRPGRRAFANLSPRTDPQVIADFDDRLDYSTLVFDAHDRSGKPIYHTNVLLSLGTSFAMLCAEVLGEEYAGVLIGELEAAGRAVIRVDYDQMRQFACNLIELQGSDGPVIALSAAARASLRLDQLRQLERFGALAETGIPTIEAIGGGSVRCMIADVHLPRAA